MAKKKFYAVRKGFKTGVFDTWDECKKNVNGYKGAEYKSFLIYDEAYEFAFPKVHNNNKENENAVKAYVDGSYEHSIRKYGSGVVILKNNEVIHTESFGGNDTEYVSMRNVAGEIMAAERAMKYCIEMEESKLILYYDYKGIENWCTGEWKANKTGTQKYKMFYESIKDKLEVEFVKVTAHSGNKYNDMADQLAKEGLIC